MEKKQDVVADVLTMFRFSSFKSKQRAHKVLSGLPKQKLLKVRTGQYDKRLFEMF